MKKVITAYDDLESLNNVISILTLGFEEVYFIYHHESNQILFRNIDKVINKYQKVKIHFIKVIDDQKEIEEIFINNPSMVVDVSASRYLSLILFDYAIKNNRRVIYYDEEENKIKEYNNHTILADEVFNLSIEDVLNLKGANIIDQMHEDFMELKNLIYEEVENNLYSYNAYIAFIQKINNVIEHSKRIDKNIYEIGYDNANYFLNNPIYQKTKLFKINDNNLILSSYKIKKLIEISGSLLENYLYFKIKESGLFDDVKMSSLIDFARISDNIPVRCEIDVLAIKNNHLLFISCKSNKVDTDDINEIYTHNSIFGNYLSCPVLCTIEDLNINTPGIYEKSRELKVAVIDKTAISNKRINSDLIDVINKRFKYEKYDY